VARHRDHKERGRRGEDALARYLDDLLDWASDPELPADQEWAAAGQALRAGRSYEWTIPVMPIAVSRSEVRANVG
jgi:hypothetical protein